MSLVVGLSVEAVSHGGQIAMFLTIKRNKKVTEMREAHFLTEKDKNLGTFRGMTL